MKHSCRDFARAVSEAYDRPLTFLERTRLELHTILCRLICGWCHRYAQQFKLLRRFAQRCQDELWVERLVPGLTPDARTRIRKKVMETTGGITS